jgi:hypothetical protein
MTEKSNFKDGGLIMLVRDALEAHMFGRMDERLDVVELLSQYLEDPRPQKEVLKEIIERISAKGT